MISPRRVIFDVSFYLPIARQRATITAVSDGTDSEGAMVMRTDVKIWMAVGLVVVLVGVIYWAAKRPPGGESPDVAQNESPTNDADYVKVPPPAKPTAPTPSPASAPSPIPFPPPTSLPSLPAYPLPVPTPAAAAPAVARPTRCIPSQLRSTTTAISTTLSS